MYKFHSALTDNKIQHQVFNNDIIRLDRVYIRKFCRMHSPIYNSLHREFTSTELIINWSHSCTENSIWLDEWMLNTRKCLQYFIRIIRTDILHFIRWPNSICGIWLFSRWINSHVAEWNNSIWNNLARTFSYVQVFSVFINVQL